MFLIFKTKSAAIRDGDNILAVVRSTDVKISRTGRSGKLPEFFFTLTFNSSILVKGTLSA